MKRSAVIKRIIALFLVVILILPAAAVNADQGDNFCNLVFFVRFSDSASDAFNTGTNWSSIKKMYNNTGTPDYSFKNYMRVISRGALSVNNYMPQQSADGLSVNTLTLSGTRASYTDEYNIINEIIAAVNSGSISVDFSANRPDFVNTGILDNLTVIIQGNADSRDDYMYPHKYNYAGSNTFGGAATGHAGNVSISNYNVIDSETLICEDGSYSLGEKQGTISHEFLHSLGLPDLYRYTTGGDPVGIWSIMASTSPYQQYPLSVSRESLGWINIESITKSGSYTLKNVTTESGNVAYKLTTPMSASEYFVIEYRKKVESQASLGFETKIPGTGLLIYRVDTSVNGLSNSQGDNYIYIFRPGVTSAEGAADTDIDGLNLVRGAAVEPSKNETEYGTTNLADTFTSNTIYYSNGSNSGIKVSNVKLSSDGESISFDVAFADYSSLGLWDDVGAMPIASNSFNRNSVTVDGSGSVLAAYAYDNAETQNVAVKKYNGTSWSQVGQAIAGAFDPQIITVGSDVYLACAKSSGGVYKPAMYKLVSGSWQQQWQSSLEYSNSLRLAKEQNGLYASFVVHSSTSKLVVLNGITGALITDTLSGSYITNPSIAVMNGDIYAVYSDFFAADTRAAVSRYSGGTWAEIKKFELTRTNFNVCTVSNGKLYVLAAQGNSGNPVYASYDGSAWSQSESLSFMSGEFDISLFQDGATPYVAYWNGTSKTAKVMTKTASGWQQFSGDIMTSVSSLGMCFENGSFYAIISAENSGNLFVKTKAIPTPVSGYTLSVSAPAGYDDNVMWVDGKPVDASRSGSTITAQLSENTAKTLCMYKYSSAGVPIGMQVWTLSCQGSAYAAELQTGLADLMSYHGFSVRVAGDSGIRFKTGVSVELRGRLTGAGVNGFTLKEYGTVVMNSANMGAYPLVKGGAKTTFGRSYWKSGSTVNDAVFETVGGRYRFTSVLIKIPVNNYKTDFAFRGYMILTKGGTDYVFYGPVVSRSIYFVSQQVINSGQFANGSAADKFLKKVISDADSI